MGVETGISLMQQLMDPVCKETPGLLLETLHHHHIVTEISGPIALP
jgi:hypothetical protein